MNPSSRRRARFDFFLLAAALTLTVFGVVMVYSASVISAEQTMGKPLYFFKRQLAWAVVSMFAMAWFSRLDYNRLRRWVAPAYVLTALLLISVLFFRPIAGARRWIHLGPIGLQPAEFAKLTASLFLANYIDRKHSKLTSATHGLIVPLGVIAFLLVLIGKEPDLGTPALMFIVSVLVLFVAGAKVQWIGAALLSAVPIIIEELWRKPYRRARLMTFIAPFENIRGTGYQLAQAIMAVGSGGWFGKGFGASQLKLMYLPKPYTDFIFPVICEELGLFGALCVLGLLSVVLLRGIRIARQAPNLFGTLLACGITFTITLQSFFNIAMAIGLLPTKGIPLPFISFGGSSLLSTLIGVGILLSISRQAREAVA